ncbi:MAG TPA: LysR family transcriptional regulator [Stellaceae bacterium]|nr:LysR family transcriptional regulator [Stellaceae bacterium]
MDRITSMTAFVQVVDHGNFSAAAKRLELSPAMVTSHVQALEKRLGIQLLNRTTRTVSVTEAGRAFSERCIQILAEVEEAETAASDLHSTPRGTVRLNSSVALARLVTPLIADYVAIYPDVSFELIMTDRMVDLVEEGFDLALRSGPLPDSTLIARRLGLGRKILCASPTYLAHHGTPQHPSDLAEHNCLTYVNSFLDHHWRFTGPDGEHEVDVSGNLRTNSIEGMRAAALAGLGICLMPAMSIGPDVTAGRLVRLLPEFRTTEAIIQAVYPASRHLSLKVRTFLDFLVERMACEEKVPAVPPMLLNGKPHGAAAQAAALRQGRA